MPARIRKIRHDENTRAKIQTSQLINRLTDHVAGKVDLTSTQVTAALGLLRKSLPDLQAVDHSGELQVNQLGDLYGRLSDTTRDLVAKDDSVH